MNSALRCTMPCMDRNGLPTIPAHRREAPAFAGASCWTVCFPASSVYGVPALLIFTVDISQLLVDPSILGSLEEKVTLQETVWLEV